MVAKRIIPCLDVKGGRTVKGINFEGLRDVGDAVELGSYYARSGADELVYLDISATREERGTFTRLVERIADEINIPFTVGGGIGSVEDASRLLDAGADKISINSAAIASPSLIDSIASRYGNQFVVVAIDARMMEDGTWRATTHGGTRPTDKELVSWAHEAQERGAGETLACGTGACAATVSSILNGFCRRDADIKVLLRGGELTIRWAQDGDVYMTGPAETVCTGEIDI